MTRDAFIRKWLDSKKPYNDENRMAMLDDLDKVIARGMATDNTRLAELEAEGWKWWVEYEPENKLWFCVICFDGTPMTRWVNDISEYYFPTKAEAEAACLEYLLNLNTTAK